MVSLQALLLATALTGAGETVLLDFSAPWCGPCRSMEPTLSRLQQAGYPLRQINVDQNPQLAQQFSVQPIPCFVLLVNGREVDRVVGAASYDRLAQMFHKAGWPRAAGQVPGADQVPTVRGQSPDAVQGHPVERDPRLSIQPGFDRSSTIPPRSPSTGPDWRSIASDNRSPGAASVKTAVEGRRTREASGFQRPEQLALQATVRLQVMDDTGQSFGTGTIIHTHGDEALVLTCGHLFRESQGRGRILVELFAPGARGPVPGQLLTYESEQRDVGLVSFRPGIRVVPAKLGGTSYHPRENEPVFTVGCNHGQNPTVVQSFIKGIDRFVGAPNLEVHGAPVEGRSGGGLFTASGKLVGVCNAADPADNQGLYAALPTIQLELKKVGLKGLFLEERPPLPQQLAGIQPSPTPDRTPATRTVGWDSAQSRAAESRAVGPRAVGPRAPGPTATNSPPAYARSDHQESELICIVRAPNDPSGAPRVLFLNNPSVQLMQQLLRESQPMSSQPTGRAAVNAPLTVPLPTGESNPVLRAQN